MPQFRIERLGHLGDGIARGPDGAPVFAARTLPGELIEGEVTGDRIAAPRIVEPSSERVSPPCRHYRACGGCALQHAADPFVAGWKADVVRAALAAHDLDAPIRGIATSPANSRRRAVLSGHRTKKGALVGFHGRASETLTEIPGCLVLRPEILAALPAFERLVVLGGSRKGEMALHVTLSEDGLDLAVSGGKPLDRDLRVALADWVGQADVARLTWNGEQLAEARPPGQTLGTARVVPPAGAFLQATRDGQAALTAAVTEAVGNADRVVDLFAGGGTFALPLAARAEVHAVEGDAAMLAALDRGWRHAPGLRRVTTETRDLFRRPILPDELSRFDAAVIDPPRAGAEAQTDALAEAGPATIAAVSCNPTTFARDAARLVRAGYGLDWIAVVDQFRWSTHVELAARFSRH
ncbi:class I SAM-dependent RNA methyltransferase [Mesobaculum littorinae]|uniref:Class I SAM-dependent RNA methyltransferase n=1 Tax=Mesobaculum littorinae TaxID=2486419 RepID=A0A438AHJ9_9RHOB|nr:class I SAM-dependent RNA methyltransferase [Mesobaculum littorinae]RVV98095.1 class I SAM-dependent RNA methyltransferase [Mesobaculum littorinae]